jgi:peptidoglycan hydrolase CwlO-like protein
MKEAMISSTCDDLNVAQVYEELGKTNKNIHDLETQIRNEQKVMEELRYVLFDALFHFEKTIIV